MEKKACQISLVCTFASDFKDLANVGDQLVGVTVSESAGSVSDCAAGI